MYKIKWVCAMQSGGMEVQVQVQFSPSFFLLSGGGETRRLVESEVKCSQSSMRRRL